MPAQSPTLSPTLSAMTAGLRGSSSGIPASTLPTKSAPTSAPLVKMPPPKRAKIEIRQPPKGAPRDESADVDRHPGQDRAYREAARCLPIECESNREKQKDADNRDGGVL